jgi:hypothetical protein
MTYLACNSTSLAASAIRKFDRNRSWPHHPATCSRQFANVQQRLSPTEEELMMATAPTRPRRLLCTKQAAEYLSMSEWKLRRLIQDAIIPFLLDVRDLDAYIDGNKHHLGDSIDWRPIPVESVPAPQTVHSLRRAR